MDSDQDASRQGPLRRLHARGLEGGEWFALFFAGGLFAGPTGYNLAQLLLHGRLYVIVRHADNYWAYWRTDAGAILEHGLWTAIIFAFSGLALATALIYPVLILLWGRTTPGYVRLPPLSIKD
ncbi:hypothetical protein [Caulobacter sp. UNC358MFTsu5.1]|uniref:hypothetical protein n=1 Tax=Caulobacter sp. UNC358MFTsu5.1 TaxID=1449049 RepID=UPI0012DEBC75|nr:hypothetical protein [Caulobacter sp. UNC358MFTsu5.1]